jgi:hypothetical protein
MRHLIRKLKDSWHTASQKELGVGLEFNGLENQRKENHRKDIRRDALIIPPKRVPVDKADI